MLNVPYVIQKLSQMITFYLIVIMHPVVTVLLIQEQMIITKICVFFVKPRVLKFLVGIYRIDKMINNKIILLTLLLISNKIILLIL
jgi:hypothetical protein